jgi:OmcA/MtrC family decaheme c-type cytochrome
MGMRGGQPVSVTLSNPPTVSGVAVGSLTYAGEVNTVVIDNATYLPPASATLRAAGLQGYFQQIIGMDTVSLHTPSAVVAVTGDDARREVVDNDSCAQCHEWFEGHGGNRTFNMEICMFCHLPNQSSSGRTVVDPTARSLDEALQDAIDDGTLDSSVDPDDPLTYPEDAQNLKDLVHGIHSSGFRTRSYQHVRGPTRQGYYDWSHVTFPRGASTANCALCHDGDTYQLPLAEGLLATTVRTTAVANGMDAGLEDEPPTVEDAFLDVPNLTDWINTPMSSSCFYCHTSESAMAHMMQNGGLLSDPSLPLGSAYANRDQLGSTFETCDVCHGPGKTADVDVVHNR